MEKNPKTAIFLKHTTKSIKMTCINSMVDPKPFKTIWKINVKIIHPWKQSQNKYANNFNPKCNAGNNIINFSHSLLHPEICALITNSISPRTSGGTQPNLIQGSTLGRCFGDPSSEVLGGSDWSQDVDALALSFFSGKDKSLFLSRYFSTRLGFCKFEQQDLEAIKPWRAKLEVRFAGTATNSGGRQ
ncbi:hypothetical protein YC2023_077512 [Brassica napus]